MMKLIIFIVGLIVGASIIYFLPNLRNRTSAEKSIAKAPLEKWSWPDSLDAMIAAPANHEVVFKNEDMRVLKVTVVPGILDPVHTHKGRSIVWVTKTSPLLYHVYDKGNDGKLQLIRTDTINVKPEELFKAAWEKPEPPHSVENIGRDTFQLYRIEYLRES